MHVQLIYFYLFAFVSYNLCFDPPRSLNRTDNHKKKLPVSINIREKKKNVIILPNIFANIKIHTIEY